MNSVRTSRTTALEPTQANDRSPHHRLRRRLAATVAAGAIATAVAACGGADNDSGCAAPAGDADCAITVGLTTMPDSLDPSQGYDQAALQTLWTVYTGLLTYRRAEGSEGTEPIPGLAEGLPTISGGGRIYKLRLRPNLTYSDKSPVRASDFEHAIKRALNLKSRAVDFFRVIEGADAYAESDRAAGDISGIVADDRTRAITIRLTKPDGRFPNILAMTFASLVPGDTPFKKLGAAPPPGVGPYAISHVDGRRGYRLTRVPSFDVSTLPKGKVATIDVKVVSSRRRLTQETIRNRIDVMAIPPAPDQLRDVRRRHRDRYREFVTSTTDYFYLNERIAPFDDLRVRQAANLAVDQSAIARLYGGLLEPSCNLLPPSVPGHRAVTPCPAGDPRAPADITRARKLIEQAGAKGQNVQVWASDEPEFEAAATAVADALNRIGLEAKPKIIDAEQYFATYGDAALRVQTGILEWAQDFPHPANFLQLLASPSIPNGLNPGFVRDPVIDRTLARIDQVADLDTVKDDYAALDRRIAEQAHILPLGYATWAMFLSERMSFAPGCTVAHPIYRLDFTSVCVD